LRGRERFRGGEAGLGWHGMAGGHLHLGWGCCRVPEAEGEQDGEIYGMARHESSGELICGPCLKHWPGAPELG